MLKYHAIPATCVCPTCGGITSRNDAPMVDLSENVLIVNGKIVKLTKRQAELVYILVKRFPKTATIEQIAAGLTGWGNEWPSDNLIKVFIYQIRERIQWSGLSIETVFGVGYKLVTSADV